jgi:hypothetical protein
MSERGVMKGGERVSDERGGECVSDEGRGG